MINGIGCDQFSAPRLVSAIGVGQCRSQGAAAHLYGTPGGDRVLRFPRGAHRYGSKGVQTPGAPAGEEVGFDDSAVGGAGVSQVVFRDLELEWSRNS